VILKNDVSLAIECDSKKGSVANFFPGENCIIPGRNYAAKA